MQLTIQEEIILRNKETVELELVKDPKGVVTLTLVDSAGARWYLLQFRPDGVVRKVTCLPRDFVLPVGDDGTLIIE